VQAAGGHQGSRCVRAARGAGRRLWVGQFTGAAAAQHCKAHQLMTATVCVCCCRDITLQCKHWWRATRA